jgi:hypothetical protein
MNPLKSGLAAQRKVSLRPLFYAIVWPNTVIAQSLFGYTLSLSGSTLSLSGSTLSLRAQRLIPRSFSEGGSNLKQSNPAITANRDKRSGSSDKK